MPLRLPRPLKRLALLTLALTYLTFAATGCGADRLILGQDTAPVDPAGAQRRTLTHDGRTIEYWVARSPAARDRGAEPAAYVLYFTGKATQAQRWVTAVADRWGDHPIEMWAINYPGTGGTGGSGGTDGSARLAAVTPASLALYDHLQSTAAWRPIFIEGGSFGTAPALHVAANRPVAGLVLQNPPPLRQLILGHYGWWNLWLLAGPIARAIPADLDSLANAAKVTAPAVFLSAGADSKVPAKYHQQVIDAYAGPKRVIRQPSAGHDTPMSAQASAEFSTALDDLWKRANLPPTQPAAVSK
jgi:hypothetical protein